MARKLRIEMKEIQANLDLFDHRANDAIAKVFQYHENVSETRMRSEASWTDRTTNARNALNSTAERTDTVHTLTLAHGVSYGIFLETMQHGRFGIIVPTWIQTSDELWSMLSELFQIMDGG